MKQLFLGSAALLLFSCAILIFQISCSKDSIAQPTGGNTGKIYYSKRPLGNFSNSFEGWIADYDGSNATRVFFDLPGWYVIIPSAKFSGDGTKLFFTATDSSTLTTTQHTEIFSSNIDGSNVQQVTYDNTSGYYSELMDLK